MSSDLTSIEDIKFFRFTSLVPDAKALLTNSKFEESKYGSNTSLLVCSSHYGYFIAGTLEGFVFGQSENLRDAIDNAKKGEQVEFTNYTEIKAGNVSIISLSNDELRLFVGLMGGVLLAYDIYDIIQQKGDVKPTLTYQFDKEINAILPNPIQQDIVAVCLEENDNTNTCELIRLSSSPTVVSTFKDATSASWSPKDGSQIVYGCRSGSIKIYDMNGTEKDFPLPENVKATFIDEDDEEGENNDLYVTGVLWIEQNEIFVIYSTLPGREPVLHRAFIFDQTKVTYLDEIQNSFNDVHPKCNFHFNLLSNFGPETQYLLTVLNSSGIDTDLFGKEANGGKWARYIPDDDNGLPEMPLNEDGQDSYPVGAAIDLSVLKPLAPVDPSTSDEPVPPMPIFFFLTTEGCICAYHMYQKTLAKDTLKFQGMITSKGLDAVTKPASITSSDTTTTAPVAPATTTAFGENTTSTTFQMGANKPPSNFSFSSAAKTINNASSFGKPASPTPGFGSTLGSSSFGTTGFGSTAFGSAAPSAVQTVSLASLLKPSDKNEATPTSGSGFGGVTFKPSSFSTSNDNAPSFNQTSSLAGASMFSSEGGAKRIAVGGACDGFGLGGFSKALQSDDSESDELTEEEEDNDDDDYVDDEEDNDDDNYVDDEEEEEEDEDEYEEDEYEEYETKEEFPARSNILFAKYKETEIKPSTHERTAKEPSAKKMEDLYFDTLEELEQIKGLQNTLQDKITFLSKTNSISRHADCFEQTQYQWRLSDMEGIRHILDDALVTSTEKLELLEKSFESLQTTLDRDDDVIDTFNNILDLIEQGEAKKEGDKKEKEEEKTKTLQKIATLAKELTMKPIDLHTFNEPLYKELKEKIDKRLPKLSKKTTSHPSLYALRQAIRYIDTTLNRALFTVNQLQTKTDTKPKKQLDNQRSHVLSDLYSSSRNKAGLVQKTVAK